MVVHLPECAAVVLYVVLRGGIFVAPQDDRRLKGPVPNAAHSTGHHNGGQLGTAVKGLLPNADELLGQRHPAQAPAVPKGLVANVLQTLGQGHRGQVGTASKGPVLNGRNALVQPEGLDLSQPVRPGDLLEGHITGSGNGQSPPIQGPGDRLLCPSPQRGQAGQQTYTYDSRENSFHVSPPITSCGPMPSSARGVRHLSGRMIRISLPFPSVRSRGDVGIAPQADLNAPSLILLRFRQWFHSRPRRFLPPWPRPCPRRSRRS